jgi:hypothetical protein
MKSAIAGGLRFLRDNLVDLATVAVAFYFLIKGQVSGFAAKDVPALLSVVVGLIGLNSVELLIDRQVRLRKITAAVERANSSADTVADSIVELQQQVRTVGLSVSALRLGASATQLLVERPEIPRERIMHAEKIYWSGVTLRSSLRQQLHDLNIAISHGADVRILIIDPSKIRLKDELTFREDVKYEYIDAILKSTELNLQLLASGLPPGSGYRLGLHRVLPSYGMLILDPDDSDGVCYVELYHPEKSRQTTFVVHATADAAWFRFFVDQFDATLKRSEVYRIMTTLDVENAVKRGAPDA